MGLSDLVNECAAVYDFLRGVWSVLPVAVQILVYATFGGIIFISVLRSIWR